jgi:hypothetical protein
MAGLSAMVIALAAIRHGPAAVRAWIGARRAETEAAQAEAETIRLSRQRALWGWSANGVETYGVELVTEKEELEQASAELASGRPTAYIVLRVSESTFDNSGRGHSLRQLVKHEKLISRAPTTGEREALETGLDTLGIARARYGQVGSRLLKGDGDV